MDREILYTIGDIANLLEINASKIRFWMKQFPEYLSCVRTNGGQRRFTYSDYCKIKTVKTLVEEQKLTLDGVKNQLILEKSRKEKFKMIVNSVIGELRNGTTNPDILVDKLLNSYL
ncbi:MAG: MerR family transcriptional regulator [Candidatus Muiribacteriota bacterium]|jgi:DNA-binding transcriptional MerR regulator